MNARQKYRRFVCFLLIVSAAGFAWCAYEALCGLVPARIQVSEAGGTPQLFTGILGAVIEEERVGTQDAAEMVLAQGGEKEIENASVGDSALYEAADTSGQDGLPGAGNRSGWGDGLQGVANVTEPGIGLQGTSVYGESYQVRCSLFGKIPLKTVEVSVVPRARVYLGGTPIGIYMETDGVLVVETGEITCADGAKSCPARNIVKSGDYIRSVDGEDVNTKEELIACIGKSGGTDVVLGVERAGELINLRLKPVCDEQGSYRAGIWVRNDTQGIGTLTYVDEEGNFGALGHGISDVDTGDLLDIRGGILYNADVVSVVRGTQGVPGELSGVIHYSDGYRIGTIRENCGNGIYGAVSGFPSLIQNHTLCEAAHRQEVTEGPATILCTVGSECQEYDVRIREVRLSGRDINKGMVIEVTDPRLLELTGGIVQGMSGSPILQNGRIVGAVTHVFVNDSTKGYGIFIENMLGNN